MSAELVPTFVATADEIATLPPPDRAVMVTQALVESKAWLAVATKGTDPTPIKEFKAWAATVAEMTKQKGLASEIQADALEMLRRAERGIGQAVRNGQEEGTIQTVNDSGPRGDYERGGRLVRVPARDANGKSSPKDFFSHATEQVQSYAMADGVTEDEFEQALTEAREEGNLSRANVVRKIKGQPSKRTRDQLADEIAALADRGFASAQIAKKVDVVEAYVKRTARDYGIDIPADKATSGTRRLDSIRIAREAVMTADGLASTVNLVTDLTGLNSTEAQQWTASLTDSIKALQALNRKIKEAVL